MYSKYYTNFNAALTVLDRISRAAHWKKFIEVSTLSSLFFSKCENVIDVADITKI
jgi:hypothetical protein